jgi:septum formation protein
MTKKNLMNIYEKLKDIDLILGSQSPRRQMLLEAAGFQFRTLALPTPENFDPGLEPTEIARILSMQKAEPFKGLLKPNSIVITADTIVVKGKQILNKASTPSEAFQMLSLLNGTSHEVITGVSITSAQNQCVFSETTKVVFQHLTDSEINYYIENYKPFDKAGAYGIQEWMGMAGVERIEGCYYNVVGLPVATLYKEMKNFMQLHF